MAGTLTPSTPRASVPSFGLVEPARNDYRHLGAVGAVSVGLHVILLLVVATVAPHMPSTYVAPAITSDLRPQQVTKLVAPPPSALTQKAPNQQGPTPEFNIAALPPRPAAPNVPSSPGAAAPPRQRFALPDPKTPANSPVVPDTPGIDDAPQISAAAPPAPAPFGTQQLPPPRIEPQEPPKIAFERPGVPMSSSTSGVGRVAVPTPSRNVDEIARQAARGGRGGLIVGDEDTTPGAGPASPASIPGKLGSAVELLSDPQGVDFWPYLVKVLAAVRRNWFAVIPESARMGRPGRVVIQFAVNRDGSVPKLVIATPSGADPLDRAAVAGISASNPFPPLPSEFRGNQVRLQLVFKYNVK